MELQNLQPHTKHITLLFCSHGKLTKRWWGVRSEPPSISRAFIHIPIRRVSSPQKPPSLTTSSSHQIDIAWCHIWIINGTNAIQMAKSSFYTYTTLATDRSLRSWTWLLIDCKFLICPRYPLIWLIFAHSCTQRVHILFWFSQIVLQQ